MKRLRDFPATVSCLAFAASVLVAAPGVAQERIQDGMSIQDPVEMQMQETTQHAMSDLAPAALIIRDFVLSRGIEGREPADRTEAFRTTDGQAYAFLRIANDGPPTDLTIVWRYEGAVHGTVDLAIGSSPGWRTWSSANLKPGDWTVEVSDAEGVVLAQRQFTVDTTFASDPATASEESGTATFRQITQEPGDGAVNPAMDGTPMRPSATQSDSDG